MKNKLLLLGALIVATAVVLPLAGCGTVPTSAGANHENLGTFGQSVIIPGKDFETRGLVFIETVYQASGGTINGQIFTYQALLKEAQKLGADAIINVTIDKLHETVTQGSKTSRKETWYGSALAVRYTNTIIPAEWNTPSGGGATGGGVFTSNENQGGGGILGGLLGGS